MRLADEPGFAVQGKAGLRFMAVRDPGERMRQSKAHVRFPRGPRCTACARMHLRSQ